MKKLLILFMLFTLCTPAFATIPPPQWSDFCPAKYANAEHKEYKMMPTWAWTLLACSIVGTPFAFSDLGKSIEAMTNNYWVSRREKFNQKIKECQNIKNDTELMYKYLSIRQDEIAENNKLETEAIRAQQNAMAASQNAQYMNNQSQLNAIQSQQRFDAINNNLMYH